MKPYTLEDALAPDPLIDALVADVDMTQIEENLRLSVEERFEKFERALKLAQEMRDSAVGAPRWRDGR